MRKLIFIMSLLFTLTASAQTAYQEAKILDNISIGIVGGATTPLDFNSVFPLNGAAGLKIQKDFTPVFGLNVEGIASFGNNHYGTASTVVKVINTSVNGTVNLSNLLCGYLGHPRNFEISTETGLGWLHSWTGSKNYLTAKTGAVLAFNLSDAHSIVVNPAVYWNLSKANKIKFDKHNAQLGLLVGYVYHFPTSNGTHSFKTYDITALNNEINSLKAELAEKPTEVVKEVVKEVTTVKEVHVGSYVVYFAQNSDELTAASMTTLSKISEGTEVNVIGEASIEGTVEYNQQLSEKRAKVVTDFLTERGVKVTSSTGIGATNVTSGRIATVILK